MTGLSLSATQWAELKSTLEEEARKIVIPFGIGVTDVRILLAEIDALYTKVNFLLQDARAESEKWGSIAKAEKNKAFLRARASSTLPITTADGTIGETRVTDEVAKAYSEVTVSENEALSYCESESRTRLLFLEDLMGLLRNKQGALITSTGILKLEHSPL